MGDLKITSEGKPKSGVKMEKRKQQLMAPCSCATTGSELVRSQAF